MKKFLAIAAVSAMVLGAASASAASFPAYGLDPSANLIITFSGNGAASTFDNGYGPYDGVEDTYIGVINNSNKTISHIDLSSALCISCFDGDGLAAYGAPTPYDGYGYGGPDGYFTNIAGTTLTINFVGGVAPGATTYFSLEEPVNVQLGVPEPATWGLMILGMAGVGYALRRRTALAAA